jgi:hypothetical protein
MFLVCGKVDHQNVCIWGTEHPHAVVKHTPDSPKVKLFGATSSCKVYGLFFFAEPTVVADINYLDRLQLLLMPQLHEYSEDFIVQHEGPLPHLHLNVSVQLSANLPCR